VDGEAWRNVNAGRHQLGFESLLTIDSHKEHLDTVEYLRETGRPAIVIAASGMCAYANLFKGFTAQANGTPRPDTQRYAPNTSKEV